MTDREARSTVLLKGEAGWTGIVVLFNQSRYSLQLKQMLTVMHA